MNRLGSAAVAVLVAGVSLVGPAASSAQGSAPCPLPNAVSLQSMVNAFRTANGRSALPLSAELDRKAQAWAEYMAATDDFRHSSLTTGVSAGWAGLAENIAYNTGSLAAAERSLELSPLHRRNLLDGTWVEMGLGVARSGSGRLYVAQEFAARARPTAWSVPAAGAMAYRSITPRSVYYATIPANTVRRFKVAGTTGIPSTATAAVVSLAAVAPSGSTLRLVPTGTSPFGTAMATVIDGRVATTVFVPLAVDGTLGVVASAAARVQAVVVGYFTKAPGAVSAGRLVPVDTATVLDADVAAGLSTVQVAGAAGLPASGLGAVVLQVTASESAARGSVQVGQPTMAVGGWTSLTVPQGRSATSLAVSALDGSGRLAVRASTAMHVRLVVRGRFTTSAAPSSMSGLFVPVATSRVFDSRRSGAPAAGSNTVSTRSVGALPQCGAGITGTLAVIPSVGSATQLGASAGFVEGDDRATVDDGTGSTQRVTVVSGTGGTDSLTIRRVDAAQAVLDVTGWFL